MALKLILVSVDGTIGGSGKTDDSIINEIARFAYEMSLHGVQIALWSSRAWDYKGESLPLYMSRLAGVTIRGHGASWDQSPGRSRKDSAATIMASYGAKRWETILLGSSDDDMKAGVANKLLYIRADWYGKNTDYGFQVKTIDDLRKFCLTFALRSHIIFWAINKIPLQVASAGPFSTIREAYTYFGVDAKNAAKHGTGHPDFWFYVTVSSLYFSGFLEGVDYICSYPSHDTRGKVVPAGGQEEVLARLGQCFNTSYFHDLILRHTPAAKSQHTPAAGRKFSTQINSIHLNKFPCRNLGDARKTAVSLKGKCVLIVDDIITSGRSIESARAYIEAAGGRTRLFGWLKTINTSYQQITDKINLDPFKPNGIIAEPNSVSHSYDANVIDAHAPSELDAALRSYERAP